MDVHSRMGDGQERGGGEGLRRRNRDRGHVASEEEEEVKRTLDTEKV